MSDTAKNLIALCLGIVLALTIAEALFRYFYPQPMYAIRYSDIGWEHVPGESFWHMGETREFLTHVSYNSHGMRDREYSVQKPEGTYRILVLGDSYAEGLEVAYEELHTELLEAALNSRAGDCGRYDRFEVLNGGVSAYDTAQEWQWYLRRGLQFAPDMVIILYTSEKGSPFVNVEDGRVTFHEPQYSTADHVLRWVKTKIRSNSHLLSFLMETLRLNSSVKRFLNNLDIEAARLPDAADDDRSTSASDRVRASRVSLPRVAPRPAQNAMPSLSEDAQEVGEDLAELPLVLVGEDEPYERWYQQALIMEAFADDVVTHGGLFVVGDVFDVIPERLPRLFARSNVYRLNLSQPPKYHFPLDGHWTPEGHERVAVRLFDFVEHTVCR